MVTMRQLLISNIQMSITRMMSQQQIKHSNTHGVQGASTFVQYCFTFVEVHSTLVDENSIVVYSNLIFVKKTYMFVPTMLTLLKIPTPWLK
jgi:hypothetical protein